ncbi:MAG: ArsA family ATPase [archaeon]|nr:ArsA family ATPase [archaeon]MCP8321432.1 ArsA family ATPase [archaeon]
MEAKKGLGYLDFEEPKIVAFCGKGGVGKTTCATAAALHFAKRGLRTLLISSDPTPSLSDILEVSVRGKITPLNHCKSLNAIELDYNLVVERWKEKFGHEVYEVLSSFLPVGEEIIDYVAGAPGIDEEFALSFVLDTYESNDYDLIVWDTAPAGGTLSLIKLQDKFYRHLGEAAKLYVKVRKAVKMLTKGRAKRDPLNIMASWENLAKRVLDMLRDKKTHAIIVTIPEALGVHQTERVFKELEAFGMHVSRIIVNYVVTEDICYCEFHKQRASMQKCYLTILKERYEKEPGLAILPQLPHEVRGIKAIKKVEELLF